MYKTIADIRSANDAAGEFWFSPDTLRFFDGRVLAGVIGGNLFITSERYDMDSPRAYTVRRAHADGSIDTVGEFMGYVTANAARNAARGIARDGATS